MDSEIITTEGNRIILDEEDARKLAQYFWHVLEYENEKIVFGLFSKKGKVTASLLKNEILGNSYKYHVISTKDGNEFDFRRSNLFSKGTFYQLQTIKVRDIQNRISMFVDTKYVGVKYLPSSKRFVSYIEMEKRILIGIPQCIPELPALEFDAKIKKYEIKDQNTNEELGILDHFKNYRINMLQLETQAKVVLHRKTSGEERLLLREMVQEAVKIYGENAVARSLKLSVDSIDHISSGRMNISRRPHDRYIDILADLLKNKKKI